MKKKVNLITAITATFVVIALALASCAPIPNITSGSGGGGASPNGTSSGGGSSEWGGTSSNKSSVSITVKGVGASSIRAIPSGDVDRLRSETAKYRIIFRNAGATRTRETTGGTVSELFEVGTEVRITVECLNSKNQVIVRSIEKAVTVGGGTKSVAFKLSEDGEEIVPTDDGQTDPDEGGGDTPGSDTPGGDTPAPNPPAPVEYVNITFKEGFILTDNQGQLEWQPFTGASLPQDGNKQKGATVERPEAPEEYSFKGWIEGDQAPPSGGLPSSYVTKYTSDMTLSAIWERSAAVMFEDGGTGFQNQTAPVWMSQVYVEKGTSFTLPDYGEYWPDPDDGSTAKKHTGWTYGNGMSAKPGDPVTITDNVTFTLTAENLVHVVFFDDSGCFASQDYWISGKYVAKGGTCELPSYDIGSFDTFAAKHKGWERHDEYGDPIPGADYLKGQSVTITEDMIDQNDWAVGFYLQVGEQGVNLQIGNVYDIILPADGSIYERNNNPDDPYSTSLYFIWKDKPFTLPHAKKVDDDTDVVTWELTGNDPDLSLSKAAGATVSYDEWFNIGSSGLSISPQ